jgi:predicted flap endonuclease-1-like 5' DNA nuclease
MPDLIATHWFSLVLALLAGVADGYWLWRRKLTRFDWFNIWLAWTPPALAGGLVVAILNWLPERAGLYVETFLLLLFGFIGCLLGAWLRDALLRHELAAVEAAATAVTTVDHALEAPTIHPGTKPLRITAPESGKIDDLKLINGIGAEEEKICNTLGVYYFHQIADWTHDMALWVAHHIAFRGRIDRERWIPQARLLASSDNTGQFAVVRSAEIIVGDSADAGLNAALSETLGKVLTRPAAVLDGNANHPGQRPYSVAAPCGGVPDDLKRIRGIGPQNEDRLHRLGIWHFAQMAAWNAENVKWIGSYLAFPGRIDRERWTNQARELAAGHGTEYSCRLHAGEIAACIADGSHEQTNQQIVEPPT